ncbi:MAG: fibronectin type III domain-containing protein [Candidatus Sulfotelmatobacter sp.]
MLDCLFRKTNPANDAGHLVTSTAAILSFAATLWLLGCGGWSSSTTEAPTGPGTTPQSTHTVTLSWTASTSSDVSGYNIYRATYTDSCGSFSQINDMLNASTLYTDSEVTDGASYCYAATTVSTRNEESGYSNIAVDVQIPPP